MLEGINVAAQAAIIAVPILFAVYLLVGFHPLGPPRVIVTLRVAGAGFFLLGAFSRIAVNYESHTLFVILAVPQAVCGLVVAYLVLFKLDLRLTTEAQIAAAADVEFTKAVMDNSVASIVVIDEAGVVVEWNRTAVRTFGFTRDEAIGVELCDLIVPPSWRVHHLAGLARQRKGERGPIIGRSVELKALRKNGVTVPVELSVQPLDYNGQRRYVGFMRDLTNKVAVDERYRLLLEATMQSEANERSRIADELHDDVVQVMVAAMLQLDVIKYKLNGSEATLGTKLDEAVGTLRLATDRTRSLMFDLHGQALVSGLGGAVKDLCATPEFAEFECDIQCTTDPIDPLLEELLFRSVRESLLNARKHSRAERLQVRVRSFDDRLEATVSDDGVGFVLNEKKEMPGPQHFHRGIPGMTERVEIAGGHLDVFTSPGIGCTVFITLPNRPGAGRVEVERPFVAIDR